MLLFYPQKTKIYLDCFGLKLSFHEKIRTEITFIHDVETVSLHKKWSFPLRISSANVTKSAGNCLFGHIYRKNLWWKFSFFVHRGVLSVQLYYKRVPSRLFLCEFCEIFQQKPKGCLEPRQTSKMELFAEIVNGI